VVQAFAGGFVAQAASIRANSRAANRIVSGRSIARIVLGTLVARTVVAPERRPADPACVRAAPG
jgi:hypothetical protein